jgi:hypothetical protein
MKIKVRHGAVTWQREGDDGREITETAFRSQVVDIPAGEAERLKALGAVVDPGEELPMGGRLSPVPSTASDAELVAWASVANREEILAEIKRQPALGDRILAAFEVVQQQLRDQNELLGGLRPEIEQAIEEGEAVSGGEGDGEGDSGGDGEADLIGSPPATDVNLDEVVAGNVDSVSKFLSENPAQAAGVLEAENRRASQPGANPPHPRQGVLAAVEAAAAHSGS